MAKKTYVEVLNQIEALRKEADRLKREEADGVILRIREAVDAYGLTVDDIFGKRGGRKGTVAKKAPTKRPKAAAKAPKATSGTRYGDGKGNTWGGRGPRPAWLRAALAAGASLESFAGGAAQATATDAGSPAAPRKRGRPAGAKRATAKRVVKAKKSSKRQAAAVADTASQDAPAAV